MDRQSLLPQANGPKFFIQRDYSSGMAVQFKTDDLPHDVLDKGLGSSLKATIERINELYKSAEELTCRTCFEGCFACLTSYFILCCTKPHYEKMIKAASAYIEEQNKNTFIPQGVLIIDPIQRGLRVIEVCMLNSTTAARDGTLTV